MFYPLNYRALCNSYRYNFLFLFTINLNFTTFALVWKNIRLGKTSRHSWITYRLGEFYLNYAEAIFQYTGSADNAGEFGMTACEAVNIIRNRTDVKMPEFPTGLSADAFWNKYQNERMVELAFEGHRFYDLRRWKDGDKLKSIIEMKLTKNEDGTITYKRNVVNRVWDDKMYLFPIPQSERMKNPNLSQNAGW